MALKLYRPISTINLKVDGSTVSIGEPADLQVRTMTAIQYARRWTAWKDQDWSGLYDVLCEIVVGLSPEDAKRIPPDVAIQVLNLAGEASVPKEEDLGKSATP